MISTIGLGPHFTNYGHPMKPFFIKIPNFWAWAGNLGKYIWGYLGYFPLNYQHPFCYSESLVHVFYYSTLISTKKQAKYLFGDQVSRISFDFLKWRSMGPQKLVTIIGHKYSIFKLSKKMKVFVIIKIRQIIHLKKISKTLIFWGHGFQKLCLY